MSAETIINNLDPTKFFCVVCKKWKLNEKMNPKPIFVHDSRNYLCRDCYIVTLREIAPASKERLFQRKRMQLTIQNKHGENHE